MTRRPLLAAAAAALTTLGALAACSDRPAQPTAPRAPVEAAAAVVTGAAPAGASTVCLAYSAKKSVVREKIEEARERHASAEELAGLQGRAEKLDEMSADACN